MRERRLERVRQLVRPPRRARSRREEPSRAGLTNTGRPSARQRREHRLGIGHPARVPHGAVVDLRQPGARQQLLRDDLVHARRRREHARADVRHVEALEQPLHRAVLAERAVQHREDRVGAEQAARPASSATAAPSHDHAPSRAISTATTSWPAALEPRAHRRGRRERDVVLGGAPAAEHGDRRTRRHPPRPRASSGSSAWSASSRRSRPTKIRTGAPSFDLRAGRRVLVEHDPVLRSGRSCRGTRCAAPGRRP